MVKIKDVKKLQQNIENDPTIRDQTANIGYFLVCTLGSFLLSFLVTAPIINGLDHSLDQSFKNEDYKSH